MSFYHDYRNPKTLYDTLFRYLPNFVIFLSISFVNPQINTVFVPNYFTTRAEKPNINPSLAIRKWRLIGNIYTHIYKGEFL